MRGKRRKGKEEREDGGENGERFDEKGYLYTEGHL